MGNTNKLHKNVAETIVAIIKMNLGTKFNILVFFKKKNKSLLCFICCLI